MSFHSLHFQVRSVWLWLWRVVVRTSWSVGKPGQRGLWVMDMDGLQVGHCAAVPLPLAVLAVWWSGPLEGSVKSTSFHWWSESETATEHRDSDALVGFKSFLLPGFSRSEPEMSTYWWYWGKKSGCSRSHLDSATGEIEKLCPIQWQSTKYTTHMPTQ